MKTTGSGTRRGKTRAKDDMVRRGCRRHGGDGTGRGSCAGHPGGHFSNTTTAASTRASSATAWQHGTGTYRLPNGYEYTGDWVDGEIRGQGVARFPGRGRSTKANSPLGVRRGTGSITFADGSTYDGAWNDGRIEGSGTAVYANGVSYTGEFLNALHHGQGVMTGPKRLPLRGRVGETG